MLVTTGAHRVEQELSPSLAPLKGPSMDGWSRKVRVVVRAFLLMERRTQIAVFGATLRER